MAQTANVAPAINIFENALMNTQNRRLRDQEAQRQAELQPLQNQLLQQRVASGQQVIDQGQMELQQQRELQRINSLATFADLNQSIIEQAKSGNVEPLREALAVRATQLKQNNIDNSDTLEALDFIGMGNTDRVIKGFDAARQLRDRATGITRNAETTGSERERALLIEQLKSEDPDIAKSARIALKLEAPAQKFKPEKISSASEKELITSQNLAVEAGNNVGRFELLANDFEDADVGGGLFQGSWLEGLKDITGNQDAVTDLRKRYAAIKGSQVVKNLPPGAASDTDIALALEGFPTKNATGKQIASFMRGLAKIERETQRYNEFKSSYISEKGDTRGMLRAWREVESKKIDTSDNPTATQSEQNANQRQGFAQGVQTIGRFTVEVID
jgi:hypothetical protein